MTFKSYRGSQTSRYLEAERAHGMELGGLAVAGAVGLETLSHGPMPQVRAGNTTKPRFKAPLEVMGQLILHDLARFVPETKCYEIPKGLERLNQLRARGLLAQAQEAKRAIEAFRHWEKEVAA